MRGLKALLGYLWSYRWQTGLGVVGLLVADVAQLAIPFLGQIVIDRLPGSSGPAMVYIWAILGLALVAYASRCLWRYCLFGVARRCDVQIRRQIYHRSVHLDLS